MLVFVIYKYLSFFLPITYELYLMVIYAFVLSGYFLNRGQSIISQCDETL